MFCGTPTGLMAHLTASHDRFLYLLQVCKRACAPHQLSSLRLRFVLLLLLQRDEAVGTYNVIVSPHPAMHVAPATGAVSLLPVHGMLRLPQPDDVPMLTSSGQLTFLNHPGHPGLLRFVCKLSWYVVVTSRKYVVLLRRSEWMLFRSTLRLPAAVARRRLRLQRKIHLR